MQAIEAALDNFIRGHPHIFSLISGYTHQGRHKVPRVTTILQRCIHEESIVEWANYLGWQRKSYRETLNAAANIGTAAHAAINKHIQDKSDTPPIGEEAKNAYLSYVQWFNAISQTHLVNIILNEINFTCEYFGGTLDGLYEIDGGLYLIDYKTTNHVTFKHFLQLAAYAYILEKNGYPPLSGAIVLQLSKAEVNYHEWFLNFAYPPHLQYFEDCKRAYLYMVLWYYNLLTVEDQFDTHFQGEHVEKL